MFYWLAVFPLPSPKKIPPLQNAKKRKKKKNAVKCRRGMEKVTILKRKRKNKSYCFLLSNLIIYTLLVSFSSLIL